VIVLAIIAALYFVFFVLPIGTVLGEAVASGVGDWTASLLSERVLRIAWFSFLQAFLSSSIGLLVGLPLAYLVSHYSFAGRRLLYALTLLPFVLPSVIVVVALVGFFGRSGLIQSILGTRSGFLYGLGGIVLAHVYYDFSLGVRAIAPAWSAIDARHQEVAASLGDSRWGIFRRVTLPLLAPAVINGFLLMFLYTFLSFGIVLVFGGVQGATLEVAIYQSWFFELDLRTASALAFIQLAFLAALLLGSNAAASRMSTVSGAVAHNPRLRAAAPAVRVPATIYLVAITLFLLGPLLVLLARAGQTFWVGGLTTIGTGPGARDVATILRSTVGGVILRSLLYAGVSGGLAFVLATSLALSLRGRVPAWLATVVELPLAMSLVTVAVGFSILYGRVLPLPVQVIAIQTLVALPLAYRVIRSGVDALGSRPGEIAENLGASPFRRLVDVELPLLGPVLANGLAYALAISFADLSAVLIVGRGRITTFPVAIFRLIGFRSFDAAIALASIYLLLCALLFLIIQRTTERQS
jgi:thiamine transport system permease protein